MTKTVKANNKQVKSNNKQVKEQVKTNNKQVKTNDKQQQNSHCTINKELVLKLFKEGKTPYQIAKQLGKYYSQIAPIIERAGLTWEKRSNEPTDKKSRTIYCSDEQLVYIKNYLKTSK